MELNPAVELTGIKLIPDDDIKPQVNNPKPNINENVDLILQPGSKIRPQIDEEEAVRLAERLYGISTKEIQELSSYDDKNFLIHVDTNIKNPIIPDTWKHGYVLKIVNSLQSKKQQYFDAQTQLLLFLRQQGIECPKPVMNIFGKYYSEQKIGESTHLVRLFEFLPGELLHQVPKSHHLYYQVGEFIGKIDLALKRFRHDAYDTHRTLWSLESLPELNKFLYVIADTEKQALVQQIIGEFNDTVLSKLNKFAKSIIHGDFFDQNIVVSKVENSDEYRVAGIIDFGETSYSHCIFELAIAIAYLLVQSGDIETGGFIIAGYEMLRPIPENERNILKVCVAARLCQSLVLGIYSHTVNPGNDYILTTQETGWYILQKIWSIPNNELNELWFTIADNYLKQSVK